MDFEKVVPLLVTEFDKHKIRYALIGGFAMGVLGVVRATMDVDFLVDASDLDKVKRVLNKYGYECVFSSKNVSQFVSNLTVFGEIDVLHAFREISTRMLSQANEVEIGKETKHIVRVVRPEDLIGLKVQALVNNPTRADKEYSDIRLLLEKADGKLDWSLLKDYFALFGLNSKFKELRSQYGKAK